MYSRVTNLAISVISFLVTCMIFSVANAQSSDIDWKYYGGTSSNACFFESQSIERLKPGYLRVWVKCLSQSELDGVDIAKDFEGQILEGAAQKTAKYYVPPLAKALILNPDQILTVTTFEVAANLTIFRPQASILEDI